MSIIKCEACGKSIPDESVFCMFCGSSLNEPTFRKSEPLYIDFAQVEITGPVDYQKGGFLSLGQDGRWLEFYMFLRDKDGLDVVANGKAILIVKKGFGNFELETEEDIRKWKSKADFFGEFDVSVGDFYSNKHNRPLIKCLHNFSYVYFQLTEHYDARVCFRTENNKILVYPKILSTQYRSSPNICFV